MSEIVNIHEAKTHLSRLFEKEHAGEEIILAKAGKPYARLTSLGQPKRKLGFVEGHADDCFFEPLPQDELNAWEGK